MIDCYITANKVARHAEAEYREMYPNRHHPDHRVFSRAYARFMTTGSTSLERRDHVHANPNMEERILEITAEIPGISIRELEGLLQRPRSLIQRALQHVGAFHTKTNT